MEGFTGKNGDMLTIKVPKQYGNKSIRLGATGYDNRTTANLFWYAPSNSNYQKVITYTSGNYAPSADGVLRMTTPAYGKIQLVKNGENGKLLPGVVFGLYSDAACKMCIRDRFCSIRSITLLVSSSLFLIVLLYLFW